MKIDEKHAVGLANKEARLTALEELKKVGGPFTNADEIDTFLSEEASEKEKKDRMKAEMKFARDSSTTLPGNDPLFRIQISGKKRRDKTENGDDHAHGPRLKSGMSGLAPIVMRTRDPPSRNTG